MLRELQYLLLLPVLRSTLCEFGTGMNARAGCAAFTLFCLNCDRRRGICWSGQVQRHVFLRRPITQRCTCTIPNAQHSSTFIGVCIPDICRNSVCDSSNSPKHCINTALFLVAVPRWSGCANECLRSNVSGKILSCSCQELIIFFCSA